MSFVHTGDIHLGRPYRRLGRDVGEKLRKAGLDTLARITQVVRETRAGFLVIAGDLFDSNGVSSGLVKNAMGHLASLAPIPVYILPGNHDVFDSQSLYRTAPIPSNVKVIPEGPSEFRPCPDLALFGAASTVKRGGDRPLGRLLEIGCGSTALYKVATVHASVALPGLAVHPDEAQVFYDEISSCPFDYVAMGHWHKRADYSRGKTVALYCGTPETLDFDDAPTPGTVTLVRLDRKGGETLVTTEEIPVGVYRWHKVAIDVGLLPDKESLFNMVSREALGEHPTLLRLRLVGGALSGESWFDDSCVEELFEHLGGSFVHLEIQDNTEDLGSFNASFPPGSVGEVFQKIMAQRVEKAGDPMEKALLEEAARRGVLYLSGKAEIRS